MALTEMSPTTSPARAFALKTTFVAMSAISSAPVVANAAPAVLGSHARERSVSTSYYKPSLTDVTHQAFSVTELEASDEAIQIEDRQDLLNSDWEEGLGRSSEWASCYMQLENVATLEKGWDGDESLPASDEAVMDAEFLLRQLEEVGGNSVAPMVGLDSDGYIVLTWDEGELTGSLSVYGDNTFGFFVERGGVSVKSGEVQIEAPLPVNLLKVLTIEA